MPARLSAFAIWALVAAGAVFWALRLLVSAPVAPVRAQAVAAEGAALRGDLTRLLGAPAASTPAATPEAAARFRLLGVVAPGASAPGAPGVALIAVDGKPPRAVRVGAALDESLVLQAVTQRSASIGTRGAAPSVVLELPPLPSPATGRLPAPGTPSSAPVAPEPSVTPAFRRRGPGVEPETEATR